MPPQRTPETEPWTPRGGFALLWNQSKDSKLEMLGWGLRRKIQQGKGWPINNGGGKGGEATGDWILGVDRTATGGLMDARLFPLHATGFTAEWQHFYFENLPGIGSTTPFLHFSFDGNISSCSYGGTRFFPSF